MNSHIIESSATVLDALQKLNALSGSEMTLLVTNPEGIMAGTLTDGDIRRALLRGVKLSDPVSSTMHTSFRALRDDEPMVLALRQMREHRISLIPVLDAEGRIVKIINTRITPSQLPLRAILMAGGKGERLRPLTLTTPKPLLPVADRAIIDYNIHALAAVGIDHISVTVNYMADMMEHHFAEPVAGVKVRCVRETSPLGTIGSTTLCDVPPEGNTLVMNSDLLTTISFEDMYLRHIDEKADITIAAIPYNVSVPYAILGTDGAQVVNLQEKPSYSYYANAGIYIISNALLRQLPTGERIDATDLIEMAIADGKRVVYFPINGTWIDIGSPQDYKHACELMSHVKRSNF